MSLKKTFGFLAILIFILCLSPVTFFAQTNTATLETYINILKNRDAGTYSRIEAIEALSKLGNKRVVELLINVLSDEDCCVQIKAAEALGKLRDERALEPLIDFFLNVDKCAFRNQETVKHVERCMNLDSWYDWDDVYLSLSYQIEKALEAIDPKWYRSEAAKRKFPEFIKALKDKNYWTRIKAVNILSKIGDTRAIEPLINVLNDKNENWEVRKRAIKALGELGGEEAIKVLTSALSDEDWCVRMEAVRALGRIGDKKVLGPLIDFYVDMDRYIFISMDENKIEDIKERCCPPGLSNFCSFNLLNKAFLYKNSLEEVIRSLKSIDPNWRKSETVKRKIFESIKALKSENANIRAKAAKTLGELGDKKVVKLLINALNDKDCHVRESVVGALASLRDRRAVTPLIEEIKSVKYLSVS